MAKKNVIIFDGEEQFINKKEHVYNKNKGVSAYVNVIADEEKEGGIVRPTRQVVTSAQSVDTTPMASTSTIVSNTVAPREIKNTLYTPPPSVSSVTQEIVESLRPTTKVLPELKLPPALFDDRLPNDGIPTGRVPVKTESPYAPNPVFTEAPIILPPADKPKETIIMPAPILVDSGVKDIKGQPIMVAPEVPKPNCGLGFIYDPISGQCIKKGDPSVTKEPIDPCVTPPSTPLLPNHKWVKVGVCKWEQQLIPKDVTTTKDVITTSDTTTTTTKKSTSSTTTTTTKATSGTTEPTNKEDALVEIDNFGTAPSYGGGVGGGGGAFPEETPQGVAPKKNYFWYYVAIGLVGFYLYKKFKK
jgi:hypothetical protein